MILGWRLEMGVGEGGSYTACSPPYLRYTERRRPPRSTWECKVRHLVLFISFCSKKTFNFLKGK